MNRGYPCHALLLGDEYVGRCNTFPQLEFYADTSERALLGVQNMVDEYVADRKSYGDSLPKPAPNRESK